MVGYSQYVSILLGVIGKGPMMSMQSLSIGAQTNMEPSFPFGLTVGLLFFWHSLHLTVWMFISSFMLNQ